MTTASEKIPVPAAQVQAIGSLLGTTVGDAMGLPYEGLSRRRAARLLGCPDHYRLFFGRGMMSDDTEHACIVAQAMIASGCERKVFEQKLAWRLRVWLLALPAGVGFATLRAILRLWIGIGPQGSGVFSAGNGPAMRAPVIGAVVDDPRLLRDLVHASSRVTHSDPKAEFGAFAVALAAQMARKSEFVSGESFLSQLKIALAGEGNDLVALIRDAVNAANMGMTTESFAESMGLAKGVSGYVYHTVPVAIHAWLSNQRDFRSAIAAVIKCGGDTDSTAAIVGGIVGASVGKEGIPEEWLNMLFEWPRSVSWIEKLGRQLGSGPLFESKRKPVDVSFLLVFLRNLFFLIVVLFHGFRRLLPPYSG